MEFQTTKTSISPNLQKVLDNHSNIFETLKVLPPIRVNDHAIHLILGSVPPNIRSYKYTYAQKSEIEHMVTKMLEVGIIQPSQSSFCTPVVLVHNVITKLDLIGYLISQIYVTISNLIF